MSGTSGPTCDRCGKHASVGSDTPPGVWCKGHAPNHGTIWVLETVPPHPKCPTQPPHCGGPAENDLHCSWCHWLYQQDRGLQAFGEALAAVTRVFLFVRAVDGRTIALRTGRGDDAVNIDAVYMRSKSRNEPDGWCVYRYVRGVGEYIGRIEGKSWDVAVELVDFLLALMEKS